MIDFVKLNSLGIKRIFYFDTLDSTNAYAKKENPENDTLILAAFQHAGKGRMERKWDAEKHKNITLSLVREFDLDDVHLVNFYTSYILLKTLKDILKDKGTELSEKLSLKWPNDIMLNGRKISGILTELVDFNAKPRKFIIGAGINVNQMIFPEEISRKATSLKLESGADFDNSEIITSFIKNFYDSIALIHRRDMLMELWRMNTDIINRKIRFRINDSSLETEGVVLNIEDNGGIKIKLNGINDTEKVSVFYSGEISFIY
ncbi:MAG: biotin--[acetyl-CoA-carboxylase] ligase [Ignavibacteria bacterium]|jgi:BirA family biotin operon repressor/biotin-[acetyl-CoA-carboxylase] ligase|nr:biotin--[acetyl-CoA-carboxylase] ligase [Ignavibacteria bacterium]